MDAVATLLDRELLLSGVVHELRGPITAVQGFVELDEAHPRPGLEAAVGRLSALVARVSDPAVGAAEVAVVFGTPVRVKGPVAVLERALAGLPHRSVQAEVTPDHLVLIVSGVPAEEQAQGWSLHQVERWLAEGGAGLAGARMRIAARIVGALRYSFPIVRGESEGMVYIHLPRG